MSELADPIEAETIGIGHNRGPALDDGLTFPDRDGFIAVARAMRDHWLVGFGSLGPYSRAEAWQDLIMECRYEPGRIMNGGRPMQLKPGQLVGAVSYLAKRWNWTPKAVRWFLDKLEANGMIVLDYGTYAETEQSANRGTQQGKHRGKQAKVITVCKYEIYQLAWRSKGQTAGQSEGQINGKSGANEGQQSKKGRKEEGKEELASADSAHATLAGLNGSADPMLRDVVRWMVGGDERSAKDWLSSLLSQYDQEVVRESWLKLKSDLATGSLVAKPLQTWSRIASRIAADKAKPKAARREYMRRY